ncbi:MAG TPA: HAD family hydrolase [Anaerolineae bacterium]|nr:HAD family hydrolase [Anaerolineae bacterium]HNU03212.1 HAD family hydrolase [Anaerolineae bacterium]
MSPSFPVNEAHPDVALAGRPVRATLRGRQVTAVLFDLDGTLVETDDETTARLARRLAPFGPFLPGRDVQRAARRLAGWLNERFNGGLALLDGLWLDELAQRLARRWGLIHANSAHRPLIPVAGTVELAQSLYGHYLLGIVSTRSEAELRVYLAQHGLAGIFAVLVGADSTARIKPHPQPILYAAGRLGVHPRHVVMVGDTAADVQAAKAAGALAVGVLCGFGDRADLRRADLVLPSTADLAAWL